MFEVERWGFDEFEGISFFREDEIVVGDCKSSPSYSRLCLIVGLLWKN